MKEFCNILEERGITVEDFTGHIAVLLDERSDEEDLGSAFDFLQKVMYIAEEVVCAT